MRQLMLPLLLLCSCTLAIHAEDPAPLTPADLVGTWKIDVSKIDWKAAAGPEASAEEVQMAQAMGEMMMGQVTFSFSEDAVEVRSPDGNTESRNVTYAQVDANTVSMSVQDDDEPSTALFTRLGDRISFTAEDMPFDLVLMPAEADPVAEPAGEEAPVQVLPVAAEAGAETEAEPVAP